jgi:DNA-binding transcriptional LysR family regulator
MNTLLFKYAIEIERTRSITRAAENLYMAQPNLSKDIKELEDTIGFPIFERNSKGVIPTKKGFDFLAYARKILELLEEIQSLSSAGNPDMQNISVSIPRVSYIAQAITDFVADLNFEKEINVNIQETNSMQTINGILDNKFNLGIIRYRTAYEKYFLDYLKNKELQHEHIWEFEYLALMSKDHRLARTENILPGDLYPFVEIVHGDTAVPFLNPAEIRRPAGNLKSRRIYLYERCNQFELLHSIPATYMWASPIPEKLLKRYSLVQRKCEVSDNKYKDLLICRTGYRLTDLDKKLINIIFKTKNEMMLNKYH